MQVLKFFLIETGSYDDVMLRPYTTKLDNESNAVNQLQEATRGGQIITAGALAGVAGNILTQQAQPEGFATIANGWSERRFRFYLELELNKTALTRNRQIISGYTDHVGVSNLTGSSINIDPNMQLMFNNTVLLRDTMTRGAVDGAPSYQTTVADDSQILRGGYAANTQGQIQNNLNTFGMRPEDVFGLQAAGTTVMNHGGGPVADMRMTFATGTRKSTRDNGIPSRYLAKSLSSLNMAYSQTDTAHNPASAVFGQAFGAVREQGMYSDEFFSVLQNRASNFTSHGMVSYLELCHILPDADHNATVFRAGSMRQQSENYTRGQAEHWGGTDTATLFASRLMASVPGALIENMMTSIFFTATNQTRDGKFVVTFQGESVQGFTQGLDLTGYLQRFEQTLVLEILNTLTNNSLIDINISVGIDIMGETRLWVSVGGEPAVEFVAPSFCDALYSPVMTINLQSVEGIGQDIDRLVQVMALPPMTPQSVQSYF